MTTTRRSLLAMFAALPLAACESGPMKLSISLILKEEEFAAIRAQDWDAAKAEMSGMIASHLGFFGRGTEPHDQLAIDLLAHRVTEWVAPAGDVPEPPAERDDVSIISMTAPNGIGIALKVGDAEYSLAVSRPWA